MSAALDDRLAEIRAKPEPTDVDRAYIDGAVDALRFAQEQNRRLSDRRRQQRPPQESDVTVDPTAGEPDTSRTTASSVTRPSRAVS